MQRTKKPFDVIVTHNMQQAVRGVDQRLSHAEAAKCGTGKWILVRVDETERIFHFTLQQSHQDYVHRRSLELVVAWGVILWPLWPQSMAHLGHIYATISILHHLWTSLLFLGQEKAAKGRLFGEYGEEGF